MARHRSAPTRHRRLGITAGLLLATGGLTLILVAGSRPGAGLQTGDYVPPTAIASTAPSTPSALGPASPTTSPTHRAKTPKPVTSHRTQGTSSPSAASGPPTGSAGPGDHASPTRGATPGSGQALPPAGPDPAAPRGAPTRVRVTSSSGVEQVNASLQPTYLDADGILAPQPTTAGWYAEPGWPEPGFAGTSILVGHISWDRHAGVFWNLPQVRPGARVVVTYSSGQQVRFTVTRSAAESKVSVPKDRSIWDADNPRPLLRLITCDPHTTFVNHHYEGNWVLWAVPA